MDTKTKMDSVGEMRWELVFYWLACATPRKCVTCKSPSGTGMVLGGTGLADSWFQHTSPGWGLSLTLSFFGEFCLPYHSFIIRGSTAIDKSRDITISRGRR